MKKLVYLIPLPIILMFSCSNDDDDTEKNVNEINIELSSNQNYTIQNPKFTLIISGFDSEVADQAASKIMTYELETNKLPTILNLTIPKNPESLIVPLNDKKNAQYFLNIDWDSNNDGKVNKKGDLFLDFDNNDFRLDLNNKNIQKRSLIILD